MATIASLLVNLKANTFNFDKGMKGSAGSVMTFEKTVVAANAAIVKMAGMDSVAVAAQKLSSEFVKLKFAIKGVASAAQISKLQKNLAFALEHEDAAINARNLLTGVGVGLRSAEDSANRMKDLSKRFGSIEMEGPNLQKFNQAMRILQGGGALIGVSLLADMLGEAGDKMAAFADSAERAKKSTGEMVVDFIKAIPVLGSLVDGLARFSIGISKVLSKISEAAVRAWYGSSGMMSDVGDLTGGITFDQKEFAKEVKDTTDKLRIQAVPFDQRELMKATIAYEDELKRVADVSKEVLSGGGSKDMVQPWAERAQAVAKVTLGEAKLAATETAGKAAADKYAEAMDKIRPIIEATKTPMEQYLAKLNELSPLFVATGQSAETWMKVVKHIKEGFLGKNPLDEFFTSTEKASSGLENLISLLQQPISGNALEATAQVDKLGEAFRAAKKAGDITTKEFNKAAALVGKGLDAALSADAKDLLEQVKTPIEKLEDMQKRLDILKDAGKLTEAEVDKILAFERERLFPEKKETAVAAFEQRGPALAERGSQEAFRIIAGSKRNEEERLLQRQLQQLEPINRNIAEIRRQGQQRAAPGTEI